MKKIKILFCLLLIGLITLCYNVKAESEEKADKEITDTKKLSAKCVYKGNKKNWHVYIDKKYKISVFSPDVNYGREFGATAVIVDSIFDFNQEIFVGEDGNISCENVSSLYVKLISATDAYSGCNTDGTQCHRYDLSSTKKEYYEKLTLDKEQSKVYVENTAKEEVESGNWDLICNYGKYYLFYNNTTFETNAYNKNLFTYDGISSLITDNFGSCPTTYCEYTLEFGAFDYPVINSYFTNEYESREGCYVSQQYANEYSCGILNSRMKIYHNAFSESNNSLIIKTKEEIKKFCSNVFSNLNYTDSNDCVKECMEVVKIIQKDQNLNQGQCGLSEKLILWIANIVKWLKYIVPVIVIVLGILDFIKAIGADKDDEMKKAQGRFVKRLIAAALIFIIPFIIEFVLDKMGFDANGCGIIDL